MESARTFLERLNHLEDFKWKRYGFEGRQFFIFKNFKKIVGLRSTPEKCQTEPRNTTL